ncbi:MAG: hypothetical protein ABGX26_03430 [Nautiliaceae bacterium]
MKKLFLFFPFLLLAFEVEFTKIYTKYVIPDKNAILIETKKNNLSFPFKFIKTEKGYILIGDLEQINMWLNNDFYAPDDAKFKNIKIAVVDKYEIQYNIIQKLKSTYKNCSIKKIIFLSPDEEKIITKPTNIKEKYKILLDCK